MNEHKKHGSSFSSKMGFILAAAGSAVGLGNLWRFPYLAAKYGGGSFLLIYVILAVTFGFALMITEIALGRKTGKSALYAFSTLHEKCGFIGILASIVPIIILPYYCVIGGWVIKFAWAFLTGSGNAAAADDYFSNFIAKTGEPVMWLVIFILATSVVILLGVNKGIENISKVLMPLLVVLSVIIAVFVVTRPGAGAGMFITLPKVFDSMAGGHLIGTVFFVLVLFAALTSSISLMETVVSIFVDKTKKSRKFITVCVTVYTVLMAIPSSLGFGIWSGFSIHGMSILDFFDFISNSVLMPIVAFLTCVFVGFIVKPETIMDEVESSTQKFKSKKLYIVLIKYVAPILVLLILFSSVLNALGIITL